MMFTAWVSRPGRACIWTEPFYWDLNAQTRAFSDRFAARLGGRRPSMIQAGRLCIVGPLHEGRARGRNHRGPRGRQQDEGATNRRSIVRPWQGVRVDGRVIHDMYLFQVKSPVESKGPWDYYKLVATTPAAEAFRPLSEGGCPFVKN